MVAQDTMVDWGLWSAGIRDDLLSLKDLDSIAIRASLLTLRDTPEMREAFAPIVIQNDNLSAITTLKKGRGSFKRTKHILKRYFYISELITAGRVELQWIASAHLVADMMTKAVEASTFHRLLPMLLGETAN